MKKFSIAALSIVFTTCAQGVAKASSTLVDHGEVARIVYDDPADDFYSALDVQEDPPGLKEFKTASATLSIKCLRGFRPSCSFEVVGSVQKLVADDGSLKSFFIYDDDAEQFATVLVLVPDGPYETFNSQDGTLKVLCSRGFRRSCQVKLQ